MRFTQTKSLIVENNAQERFIDVDVPLGVFDEAQLPEFVHEKADSRARRANDLGQGLLADPMRNRLRPTFLAEIRQEEQRPRQPLFARIEELIDQILLGTAVAGQ